MNDFTIGKPTTMPMRGSSSLIWEAAKDLKDGMFLPVEFADEASAKRLVNTNVTWKRHGFRVQRRGSTVYVSKITQERLA